MCPFSRHDGRPAQKLRPPHQWRGRFAHGGGGQAKEQQDPKKAAQHGAQARAQALIKGYRLFADHDFSMVQCEKSLADERSPA
jgi:hypothetical protein